jgi:hypothetical protein
MTITAPATHWLKNSLPLPYGEPLQCLQRRQPLARAAKVATAKPLPVIKATPATPAFPAALAELYLGQYLTMDELKARLLEQGPRKDISAKATGRKTDYRGMVYELSHPLPVAESKPARFIGGCNTHQIFMPTLTAQSARVWRDGAAHWCPACNGWEG